MARIDVLPSIEIIRGLKGILDFYVWRGLPCVRAWPRYRPARQTDASLAAALFFGAVVKAYSLLATDALAAYRQDALDQPRTARDIMVFGVYGRLHEASMSDFYDLLTECRDFLSSLTDLLHALDSIDTDELVVNVDQSVLPPSAATDTHQLTEIAALQKLDDLQDALESKALDRLLVRGMDQLYSFHAPFVQPTAGPLAGANGYLETPALPAGFAYKITCVAAVNKDRATTAHKLQFRHDTTWTYLGEQRQAFATAQQSRLICEIWADAGDYFRVWMAGGQNGDDCVVYLAGHDLTLET